MMVARSTRSLVAATAALAMLLTACSTTADDTQDTTARPSTVGTSASPDSAPTSTGSESASLTVTDSVGTSVVLDAPAETIVSLSPTATESLFAIGAGDQVVAVDQFSTFPADAPITDLDALNPNIEAITTYDPDLVVASDAGLADALAEVDVPLLVQSAAATFDDVYAQVDQLGVLTGHADEAATLVGSMQSDIDAAVSDAPDVTGQSYFHELDSTLYSVTGDTFIGEVYGLYGLENIADAVEEDVGGYPQLSPEFVVEANPDWVFLADASFGESAETVAGRPGWDTIEAVEAGRVVALPADVPSRWGPRVVDFVEVIGDAVAAQPVDEST